MRIYATRRQTEMILDGLYTEMRSAQVEDLQDYYKIIERIQTILQAQCKDDRTTYRRNGKTDC